MNNQQHQIEILLSQVPQHFTAEEWIAQRESIEAYITALIEKNFELLVTLLYRLDISEKKLKNLLENPAAVDSATIITDLIIERQLQKIASRQNQQRDTNIPEEDRW